MNRSIFTLFFFLATITIAQAQVMSHEDSVATGLLSTKAQKTVIGGYGEALYSQNFSTQKATASLRRAVFTFSHRFSPTINLITELEIENALAAGNGTSKGELSMEEAYLQFRLNAHTYINAGLQLPRIGIINQDHEPNTFNGNDRPVVETMLIPTTWGEIGVSLNGSISAVPGLNYTIGIYNGLNGSKFDLPTGIQAGKGSGSLAMARNKAISGSLRYYTGAFRLQIASYLGGSIGLNNETSDRLGLNTGFFGTPVFLNEADLIYQKNGWSFRALAAIVNIPDADKLNAAYANNVPAEMYGAYGEVSYNILSNATTQKQLIPFLRYEYINMNGNIPDNGIKNEAYTQSHLFAGINYLPVPNVAIKLDYHFMATGDYNYGLIINPSPYAQPWQTNQHILNLGVAYSF